MINSKLQERKNRLRKILAAQAKPQATETGETDALAIGIGPGICSVFIEGEVRHVRCEIPVVPGDEVCIKQDKVVGIAPRRTTLSRTDPGKEYRERLIAANIDLLVIVATIIDPPFSPGLVDRYLVAAARGGIKPILCVNKIDLCRDTSPADVYPIPIVRCSTTTCEGIGELRDMLAGSIAVLAGHSGVGKSSLLNALASEEKARTGSVSEETGKGRHTTTASRLYHLKNGARIIDTPGIKELGLGVISADELRAAFPEFAGKGCRFADCTHRDEPDCPVRESGGARYATYLRLVRSGTE